MSGSGWSCSSTVRMRARSFTPWAAEWTTTSWNTAPAKKFWSVSAPTGSELRGVDEDRERRDEQRRGDHRPVDELRDQVLPEVDHRQVLQVRHREGVEDHQPDDDIEQDVEV